MGKVTTSLVCWGSTISVPIRLDHSSPIGLRSAHLIGARRREQRNVFPLKKRYTGQRGSRNWNRSRQRSIPRISSIAPAVSNLRPTAQQQVQQKAQPQVRLQAQHRTAQQKAQPQVRLPAQHCCCHWSWVHCWHHFSLVFVSNVLLEILTVVLKQEMHIGEYMLPVRFYYL